MLLAAYSTLNHSPKCLVALVLNVTKNNRESTLKNFDIIFIIAGVYFSLKNLMLNYNFKQ